MSKLTVKQFATINKVSVQSVYKRLKNGSLEHIEIDNTKYIVIDDEIDFEKKYNDLQLKYNHLLEVNQMQLLLIEQFKDEKKLFGMLLAKPKDKGLEEIKDIKPKKKKKKKKKN